MLAMCHNGTVLATQKAIPEQDAQTLSKSLIREFEGLKLQRYKGLGHKEYVIGYGDQTCAKTHKTITKEQAEKCLDARINEIYARLQKDLPNLKQNQYAALISLIYNIGYGAFERSNLYQWLKTAPQYQKQKQIEGEWLDFNHVRDAGVLNGLTARRIKEYQLFTGV